MKTYTRPKPLLLRGPMGCRGANGLSAYGVWLQCGHQGSVEDFLHWLKPSPDIALYNHLGGQSLQPGLDICLLPTNRTQPNPCCLSRDGQYFAQFYARSNGPAVVSLYANDREIPGRDRKSTRLNSSHT